jgi:hypothetical protein
VSVFLWVCACGSGGSPPGTVPPFDFSGTWVVQVVDDETGCGGGVEVVEPYLATVEQAGANVTVTTPSGTFVGTVDGAIATVQGTYPDDLGFTTFLAWVLRASEAGFEGDVAWTYSLDPSGLPVECTGTSVVTGERAPPGTAVEFRPLDTVETGASVHHALPITGGCGGPYAAWVVAGQLPDGVEVSVGILATPSGNVPALIVSGRPLVPGVSAFTVHVSDPGCAFAGSAVVVFTWEVLRGPLLILDCDPPLVPVAEYSHPLKYSDADALADTVYGTFRVFDLLLVGGTPPYACEVGDDLADPDDGPLPEGLSMMGAECVLVGTPREEGPGGRPFRLTIRAMDSLGETTERKFQLAVVTPDPVLVTTSLSDATQGVAYSESLQVVDGIPPFTWSVTAGSLPDGLSLDPGSGAITGTPTGTGTSTFTVTVVDLVGGSDAAELSIAVD